MNADQEAPATAKETACLLDGSGGGDASSGRPVETYFDDDGARIHVVPPMADEIKERFLLKPRLTLATVLIGTLFVYFLSGGAFSRSKGVRRSWIKDDRSHKVFDDFPARLLLGMGNDGVFNSTSSPYNANDFQNGQNRTVRYWMNVQAAIEKSQSTPKSNVWNLTTWGPCYPRANNFGGGTRSRHELSNWTYIVKTASLDKIAYPTQKRKTLEGLCRPGYLLIGQGEGKCQLVVDQKCMKTSPFRHREVRHIFSLSLYFR